MTNQEGLKKHFEAILGQELPQEEDGGVTLRQQVATYSLNAYLGEAPYTAITSRAIGTTGDSTKFCEAKRHLDVGGVAQTGQDGTTVFMLSDFYCDFETLFAAFFDFPANFVATPRSNTPVFLTARASPTSDRRDVEVRVASWQPDGSPAPNTRFDWRCRVPWHFKFLP